MVHICAIPNKVFMCQKCLFRIGPVLKGIMRENCPKTFKLGEEAYLGLLPKNEQEEERKKCKEFLHEEEICAKTR